MLPYVRLVITITIELAITENIKHLKKGRDQLKEKKKLKALISDAQRQQKRRAQKEYVISEMSNQSTYNASKLRKFTHASSGRPPLEDSYSLHQPIAELVTNRSFECMQNSR